MMKRILMMLVVLFAVLVVVWPGPAVATDVKIRFTDKTHLNYEGDWAIISYQAYTSKTVGSGRRMGTMTCRPGLSGTYQIIAEYKATETGENGRCITSTAVWPGKWISTSPQEWHSPKSLSVSSL